MTRRYFGTDGIRGQVGAAPMTVDFALRLASAAARVLAPQGGTVFSVWLPLEVPESLRPAA
jgi:phosphoglucosamine mutase